MSLRLSVQKKCQEHGVSIAETEDLFKRPIMILPDLAHSQTETRMRAIGKTKQGRSVFIVFTIRKSGRKQLIRPISARYMHAKEVKHYEEENPNL
ncbi:MAG: BrnT family toxin [Deltaproteobacteria bacterium]|nr:BrnT family toxin [Deltaproteobacteria bacterium]